MPISVDKIIQVTTGVAPFDFVFSSDISGVTFSPKSGTVSEREIETTITFTNETVLTTAVITLTVTSACGNSEAYTVSVANVCSGVVLTGPTSSSEFVFVASLAAAGCTKGTFQWIYDKTVFSKISQIDTSFTSSLSLQLITNTPPVTTPVRVTATDCKNCVKSASLNYGFCIPEAKPVQVNLYEGDTVYSSPELTLENPVGCSNFTPDWTTLQVELPTGFSYVDDGAANISFTALSTIDAGIYQGYYSVKDDLGIVSNKGSIILTLNTVSDGRTVTSSDRVIKIPCGTTDGVVFDFDVESYTNIAAGSTIDWSSFQQVTPPTTAGTVGGSIVISPGGKHSVRYTTPNPVVDDSFAWIICDTDGKCSETTVYTIVTCDDVPVANNDAFAVDCGTITTLDILDNDTYATVPIDSSTVVITSGTDQGPVTVLATGDVIYYAPECFAGVDSFDYKVRNASGEYSNEATVTITVSCAGADLSLKICQ